MMVERRRKADKREFVAYALVVIAFAVGLWRVEDNRTDADRKIKAAAIERAEQIAAAARESRRDVLIRTCREFNRNHDRAIRKFDELIADSPPGPRRARAKANRAGTVALLETLAPKRHCVRRANRLIRPG